MGVSPSGVVTKGLKGWVLPAGYSLEHLCVRFVKINGAVFLMCALLMLYLKKFIQ